MSDDKIPREVLRWLQSLDLAHSIKNPRRDFANGFLVAEIFYRYYVKAIHIHSFDNGISLPCRKGNWSVLRKFFKKQRIPITDNDIDAVMYSRPGEVVGVIQKIYTYLTQRQVRSNNNPDGGTAGNNKKNLPAPPFMKPTAAQAIRETLRGGGDQIQDISKKQATVRESLNTHNEMLADTRTIDANRDTGLGSSKILKGETRKIVPEQERPQVVVRKVQVKSIDRSIAQLRAKQAAGNQQTSVLQGSPLHSSSVAGGAGFAVDPIEPKFNEAVTFALGPENAGLVADRDDVAAAFMERVDSAQPVDEDLAVRILRDAFGTQAAAAADASIANPREFHRAFHILSIPLRVRVGPVFAAACDVLTAFGAECSKRDAATARSLFLDLALNVVVRVVGNLAAAEQQKLLRVAAAFVGPKPAHRLELLKCCRDALYANNDAVMVGIVAAAAELEESGPAMPQELLDLYVLYCRGGLTAEKTSVRRASVGLLRAIVRLVSEIAAAAGNRSAIAPVTEMLPSLTAALPGEGEGSMVDVELQTECLHTAAVVLNALEPNESGVDLEEKIWPIVSSSVTPELRARRLALLVPHSVERGVEEMLKLTAEDLAALLNEPGNQLHRTWNPTEVAGALADLVVSRRQENLDELQMNMLSSIATQAAALGRVEDPSMEESWIKVLDKIGKYVFVALTDAVLVDGATEFLSVFLLGSNSLRLNVLERKYLVSSMMLLFRDGEVLCQDRVCAMLSAALDPPGHAAAADVAAFVSSIEQYISDPSESVQKLLELTQLFDEEAGAEAQ